MGIQIALSNLQDAQPGQVLEAIVEGIDSRGRAIEVARYRAMVS